LNLLSKGDAKTIKGEKAGYLTGILYLAPYNLAGRNVCPHASPGCAEACLFSAGMGAFESVQNARIAKTKAFFRDPKGFVETLAQDIDGLKRRASRRGLSPCVRLNGTSDIPWENMGGQIGVNLMKRFPEIPFYDYTKNPARARAFLEGRLPANYSLTFSRSECNGETALDLAKAGANVAVVFATKKGSTLPATWGGRRVVDGDKDDLRFLDGRGCIVGLRAKGKARKDETGFVVPIGGAL